LRERYAAYRMPHGVAPGEVQMRLDAALLDWVSRADDRLIFRTYGWDRPTLSLGRSEPFPGPWDADALARSGVDVARRPTGGNAVLHVEEVTFAVAASLPGPWRLAPRGFADRVADALAAALRDRGLDAEREPGAPSGERRPGDRPCFARCDRGEVRSGGFKVAGLASRFTRSGALCHASVPLTPRSRDVARFRVDAPPEAFALDRHARSLGEMLGAVPDARPLADALAGRIAEAFDVAWSLGDAERVRV